MAEKKYSSLVTTIKRTHDIIDEDADRRTLFGPAMYGKHVDPNAPLFVDIMQLFGSGTGFGVGKRVIMDGEEIFDTPHKHSCDELFVFCGTNTDDPTDLGGEVEMWIGEGEDAEQFIITEPTVVRLPAGTLHQPTYVREAHGNIVCIDILLSPEMNMELVNIYPPDYTGPK